MNKEECMILKGIAIILMFWHHLFGCGNFLVGNAEMLWYPTFGGYDVILGTSGKVCISIFCAVSGYGMYRSYMCDSRKSIFQRFIHFLISYWTIMFVVAIPYLIVHRRFQLKWIIINLFALLHNDDILYVSLSWYVKVYLEILIVLPLIRKLKNSKLGEIIDNIYVEIFFYIILPLVLAVCLPDYEGGFVSWQLNMLSSLRLFLVWYPVFSVGMIFAKYSIFETLFKYFNVIKIYNMFIILAVCTVFAIRGLDLYRVRKFSEYTEVVSALCCFFCYAPFIFFSRRYTGFGGIIFHYVKQKLLKILTFLGKYSLQYWFLSGMFFLNTQELSPVLYLPKYSVLIFIWNFVILAIPAIVLHKISVFLINMFSESHISKL